MEDTNFEVENEVVESEVTPEIAAPETFGTKCANFFKNCGSFLKHYFSQRKNWADIGVWLVLALGAVVMLFPFVWMIFATFKPVEEIYSDAFFPVNWTVKAYGEMWTRAADEFKCSLPRGFLNSILTTVPVVLVQVFVSAMAAYAFAKLDFKGKNVLFLIMLSTMMIPFAVVMLPQSWLYGNGGLHLTQGPLAVMIPKMFGAVGTVFFLRQFLYGIPKSISEAALLDGAGYMRIFASIILPLVMPALATQFILSFIGNWNDYLGPLLFIKGTEWKTLPLLVDALNGGHGALEKVPQALAASLISLIPIIVVFAVFQKKIIGSIVFSAVKG